MLPREGGLVNGIWSSEKPERQVLCYQKYLKWIACGKGAEPRPMASTRVGASLSTIS